MPERIENAGIKSVDAETIEINDTYPGTYGFYVLLTKNPGLEWGVEFETAYENANYPGKPPASFHGDRIAVYYLPRYAGDLPRFFRFFQRVVMDTNTAVDQRNSVLPNEDKERAEFLTKLRDAAQTALG